VDFGALFGYQAIVDAEGISVVAGRGFNAVVVDVVFRVLDFEEVTIHGT
jgi:hypothetical protein